MKRGEKTLIKFFGGVGRIGGNKILVQSGRNRVFLDFGKDFYIWRTYYEFPFTYPRSIHELISIDAIPRISGLYIGESVGKNAVDAVFITHAHLDHVGYISLLNREIPVYMGEGSKIILEAINAVSYRRSSDIERNFDGLKIWTFRTGKEIDLGDITIRPIHVDHSIPSAYGFLVFTQSATIAYTGDLRLHGKMSNLTEDFIKALEKEDVDVLITEGTHANMSEALMESDVHNILTRTFDGFKGLMLTYFGKTDYDRFRTIYEVSKTLNRELVLDAKRAYVLSKMQEIIYERNRVNLEEILVLRPNGKRITRELAKFIGKVESRDRILNVNEVIKEPDRYILTLSYGGAAEFINISPPKGSVYILSSSEPVNEEQEISFEKLLNWLEQLGVAVYHIHSSGHIQPIDLKNLVLRVQPTTAVAIHTERPLFLKNFINEISWFLPRSLGDELRV